MTSNCSGSVILSLMIYRNTQLTLVNVIYGEVLSIKWLQGCDKCKMDEQLDHG